MAAPQGGTIPLGSLSAEQLDGIKRTTEQEVQYLTDQLRQLASAQQRLYGSRRCAKEVGSLTEGKEILVPLTTSVYVTGNLCSTEKVMIDLGTGYFVEKTPQEAEDYFQRRVTMVKGQMDRAQQALGQKRQMLEAVTSVLQRKVSELQASQPSN